MIRILRFIPVLWVAILLAACSTSAPAQDAATSPISVSPIVATQSPPSPADAPWWETLRVWIVENRAWEFLLDPVVSIILAIIAAISVLFWRRWDAQKNSKTQTVDVIDKKYADSRRIMLAIMAQRIQEEQNQALFKEVFIEVGLTQQSAAVETPRSVLRVTNMENNTPKRTDIVDAFEDAQRSLLILGEPGVGKTTLLYELAGHLVRQAESDPSTPIPVIFNLSSWAEKRAPLDEWLLDEFRRLYGIPTQVAERWIATDDLILLLDGLDEVAEAQRADCVRAIHRFKEKHQSPGVYPLALCCRIDEYNALPLKADLRQAVQVEKLGDEQIINYFGSLYVLQAEGNVADIWQVEHLDSAVADSFHEHLQTLAQQGNALATIYSLVCQDDVLREETRYPLMLNIVLMAFIDQASRLTEIIGQGSDHLRPRIFDAYIQRMFEHRTREHVPLAAPLLDPPYTQAETIHWLNWLANKMIEHDQTIFLLERIQPTWLDVQQDRRIFGLIGGLGFGLIGGLIFGLIGGLSFGLIGVVSFGLIGGLSFGLIGGLIFGLIIGLIGLIHEWQYKLPDQTRRKVNHGVHNTTKITLIGGLGFGLIFGLIGGLIFGLIGGLITGQVFWLVFWLTFGVPGIQHYALRYVIKRRNYGPWNYPVFLEYARGKIFLRRVGGGYRFTHRLLKEHFAAMDGVRKE